MEVLLKITPENFFNWQERGFVSVPLIENNSTDLVEVRLSQSEVSQIQRTETSMIYYNRFFRQPGRDKGDGL